MGQWDTFSPLTTQSELLTALNSMSTTRMLKSNLEMIGLLEGFVILLILSLIPKYAFVSFFSFISFSFLRTFLFQEKKKKKMLGTVKISVKTHNVVYFLSTCILVQIQEN